MMREVMRKGTVAVGLALAATLAMGAKGCDSPATPRSQCQSGSTKASHGNGKTKYYECHNNEWTRVTCLNRSTKTTGGHHYTCRSNEWERDN
jgi:hypothetical protein